MLRGAPPLSQMDNTPDKADTKADERRNNEQQEQRLTADAGDKGSDPGYRLGYDRGNIRKNCSHRTTPLLQMNDTPDEADAEPHEGGDHEQKQQRVIRDRADEGANPGNGGSDQRRDVAENRGNSYRSSMKAFLQSSNINNSLE